MIIVMKDGIIQSQGSFKSLMNDDGLFADMMKSYGGVDASLPSQDEKALQVDSSADFLRSRQASARIDKAMRLNDTKTQKNLIVNEERNEGSVKGSVWLAYIYASGGWVILIGIFLALIINLASKLGNGINALYRL
jgi:hypothetical protein